MEVYILNDKYERIGYLDQSESVLWNKKYNDVGECEIYVPCTIDNVDILKKGYYVYRTDDDMLCEIETIQIETDIENGDYLIATGKDVVQMLSGRIVRWEVTYSGTVFGFIKKLIDDNVINPQQTQRKVPNFIFLNDDADILNDNININIFTDDLLETIINVCKTYNYGFRLSYNIETGNLEFRLYKGVDKTNIGADGYVEFSPTYANILSSKYTEDQSNYKNLCYIGYKDSEDNLKLMSVYNTETEPQGKERKEIYIDGSSTSRDTTEETLFQMFGNVTIDNNVYYVDDVAVAIKDGDKVTVSDYTYLILIRILGLNTLSERVKTQEFTGDVDTINTYEYKKDYNLGDIVKVINDYGIEAKARITEIMESDDNEDGYVIEPTFKYID